MPIFRPSAIRGGESGGEGSVIGGGSGQGSWTGNPMSFSQWCNSEYCIDFTLDGNIDVYDFYFWWITNGLTDDEWLLYSGFDTIP